MYVLQRFQISIKTIMAESILLITFAQITKYPYLKTM